MGAAHYPHRSTYDTVQAELLSVKAFGSGFEPFQVPLKPICVDPPGARVRFQSRLPADTLAPDWLHVAPQPCGTVWPAVKAKRSVQPLMVVVPVFLMVTLPLKPPPQLLSMRYATSQLAVVPLEVVNVTGFDAGERLPAASRALTVTVYEVDGVRPVAVKEVVVLVPNNVVPW